MPAKKSKTVGAALLGAAATALTVKTAMASAIAPMAQEPIHEAEKSLADASRTAVTASADLVSGAPAGLGGAIVHTPVGSTRGPAKAQPSSKPVTAHPRQARTDGLQFDPEKRLNPGGSNHQAIARRLLHDAAVRQGVDPKLVLAVSYWESGWDQSRVSENGAVGLMQVEPYIADTAGPSLLGRSVDLTDPYDNADMGVAILKEDLQSYNDPVMALAAYYEGPTALQQNGLTADAQQYANGILSLVPQMPS